MSEATKVIRKNIQKTKDIISSKPRWKPRPRLSDSPPPTPEERAKLQTIRKTLKLIGRTHAALIARAETNATALSELVETVTELAGSDFSDSDTIYLTSRFWSDVSKQTSRPKAKILETHYVSPMSGKKFGELQAELGKLGVSI
jgi:hypothetical protein